MTSTLSAFDGTLVVASALIVCEPYGDKGEAVNIPYEDVLIYNSIIRSVTTCLIVKALEFPNITALLAPILFQLNIFTNALYED